MSEQALAQVPEAAPPLVADSAAIQAQLAMRMAFVPAEVLAAAASMDPTPESATFPAEFPAVAALIPEEMLGQYRVEAS